MITNFKYAFRLMMKRPFFTLLTLAVMTLGMSITLTTFSIVNTMGFKDLDFPNSDRIVVVDARIKKRFRANSKINAHDFVHYQKKQTRFEQLAAFRKDAACIDANMELECYLAAIVQPEIFTILKSNPMIGRTFSKADSEIHSTPVAMISYELWMNRFLGDKAIINNQYIINGKSRQIIGVMPKGFKFPGAAMIWLPLTIDLSVERHQAEKVAGLAILKPGVTLENVKQELKHISKQLDINYSSDADVSAYATDLKLWSLGMHDNKMFNTMLISVIFVLLVACANVGSLLLATAYERKKETAIRMALGAPRWKIVAQRFTESFIMCFIGSIFAIARTAWELEKIDPLLQQLNDRGLFWWNFKLEIDTVLVAIVILLLTTVLSALYPALKASKADFNEILKDGSYGSESKDSGRVMKFLVITEIGLSCALVIVAGLMSTASYITSNVDYGIETKGYLTAEYQIPKHLYSTISSLEALKKSVRQVLLEDPGIESATFSTIVPAKDGGTIRYHKPGDVYTKKEDYPKTGWGLTDSDYFKTFNIPLLEGRFYDELDNTNGIVKTVVSKSFSDQTWPKQSAVGKRFFVKTPIRNDDYEMEVVGVIPHIINDSNPELIKRGSIYVSSLIDIVDKGFISLKTSGENPMSYAKYLKRAFYKVSPDIQIKYIMTLEDGIRYTTNKLKMIGEVFMNSGILALIFTLAGIFGVMSKTIQQKTKEIGVRRALGAVDAKIFFWLLRKGWWQLVIGLIVGLPVGVLLTFALMDMVAVVGGLIPVIFIVVILFIILVVNTAIAIPAGKALRIEPSTALRYE